MTAAMRIDRHTLVKGMISQDRDKIVAPLEQELAQNAEHKGQGGRTLRIAEVVRATGQ